MTQYLTKDEFLSQSIPAAAFTGLSDAQINLALQWASRQADSYLSKRYSLPLVSWGDDLRSAVADLAQFQLLSRRGFKPGSGNDEIAVKRRDDAMKWLRDVSDGTAALVDVVDQTPSVDEEGSLAASQPKTSFSMFTRSKAEREL